MTIYTLYVLCGDTKDGETPPDANYEESLKLGFTCNCIGHDEFHCGLWPSPAELNKYQCEQKSGIPAGNGGNGGCGGAGGNPGKYFVMGLERPTEFHIFNQSGKRILEKYLGEHTTRPKTF